MLDKLTIKPEHFVEFIDNKPVTTWLTMRMMVDFHAYPELQRTNVTGSERTKNTFLKIPGQEGILFRCKLAGKKVDPWDCLIEDVQLNPNHRQFGGNFEVFLRVMESVLNPTLFERGRVTRGDYALNLPIPFEVVVRGLHFAGRSKHILGYNLASIEYLLIGERPCTLAIYDLNRSDMRHHRPVGEGPWTRLELRMFDKEVPSRLQRFYTPQHLRAHVRSIAEGEFNPLHGVMLYTDYAFPPLVRPQPSGHRPTRADFDAALAYGDEMAKRARIQGMQTTVSHGRVKALSRAVGSGLRATWDSMTMREVDLTGELRLAAQRFLGEQAALPLAA